MTSEIYDKSREELIRRELEELKLCLRKSEAEREELAKDFLNQCDRIEVLETTAEDLNERPAHQQGFSKAVLDRLRTAFNQKDKIAKKLSWSVRESKELFKRNKRLQLSIVNAKMLEQR